MSIHSHPSYQVWNLMKQRCLNPNNPVYYRYGGRGITVCERWLKFANFNADMGPRSPGKSLDRINNDGNYEPGNCRWATAKEQANNKRQYMGGRVTVIEQDGKRLNLKQWSQLAGISVATLWHRLNRQGLTQREALSNELTKLRTSEKLSAAHTGRKLPPSVLAKAWATRRTGRVS